MIITLPDNLLREAGLNERDAQVEFACHLFDTERLSLWQAAQVGGLSRVEFESELHKRGIAIHRVTAEYWAMELESLRKLESAAR